MAALESYARDPSSSSSHSSIRTTWRATYLPPLAPKLPAGNLPTGHTDR